jgi:large repetitive protein
MRVLTVTAAALVLAASVAAHGAPPPPPQPARSQAAPVLEGTVVGPDGKLLAGAVVAARRMGEPPARPVTGQTDDGGQFRLTLASASPHVVRVEVPGLAPRMMERVQPGRPLRVSLARGGVVEGVIREGRSGAPVPGAVVEGRDGRSRELGLVWDARMGVVRATADAQGRFKLAGLGSGPYTVTAAARGIGRAQRRSVTAGARVELVLLPSGSVAGVVGGPDGRPSTGALVLLEPAGSTTSGDRLAVADGEGRFTFPGVEPGRYRVIARHKELAPAWQTVVVDRQAEANASLRLGPPLAVTGRLVDLQERPVRGRVTVSAMDRAAPPRALTAELSTEAAADGRFRLAPLPAGSVTFTAVAARFAPRRVDADLAPARRELDLGTLALESGLAIHGFVKDPRGQPVADARVMTQGPKQGASAEDTTETDGSFVLAGLQSDRYRVSVHAPGFGAAEREVEAGGESVVLVLHETGKITGVVVDGAGAAVGGYQILARPQPSPARVGGAAQRLDVESAEGRFTIEDLAADTYVLAVIAPDREPGGVSNVVVGPGSVVDVGHIRLGTGGIVRGMVVDATGAGVAGAVVRAALPRRMMVTLGAGSETGSDATGAFELRGVPAGSIRVTARHPDYAEGEAVVEVEPARGPTEAQMVLHRGGRVQGHARRRDGSAVAGSVAIQPMGGSLMPFSLPETIAIGADGSFLVDHVPAGRARVALMIGPATWSSGQEREVEVREGRTTAVAFDLREVLVTGRVTRAGTPAANLRIRVNDETPLAMRPFVAGQPLGSSVAPQARTALTREDGTYELMVDQAGTVQITLEAPDGSLRLPARMAEIPDVERHVLDLDFGGVVLAGTVVDEETDRPLPRANVIADPHDELTEGRAVAGVTAADGRFQLEVDPGRYRVSARVGGYSGATTEVDVQASGVSGLRLPLTRGGTVRGRVVDPSGRPAGDGIVRAIPSTPGAETAAALLLPDGRFELTGLGDTEHTLVARSDAGGFALRSGVLSGTEEVTLVLHRGGRIQLKLIGPDGAPVVGAFASVFRVDGVPSPGIAASSSSDARGFVEILSPTGQVEVRANKLEGAALVAGGTATIVVEEGSTTTAEVLLVDPTAAWRQE